MKKWDIKSVIVPELIGIDSIRETEEIKLLNLLENGYEPFAILYDRVWLRKIETV